MINSYRPPVESKKDSKRWATTTESSMKEASEQLNKMERVSAEELKDRRMNNNKTVICFGHDTPIYISDAMDSQAKVLSSTNVVEDPTNRKQRLRKLKSELTATNFILGDDVNLYVRQKEIPPNSLAEAGRSMLSNDAQEAMKKSSIHFGNDNVDYQSVAHQSMEYMGNEGYMKMKSEVSSMTKSLRKHNFSFGEDVPDYKSFHQLSYTTHPLNRTPQEQEKLKSSKEASRKSHFSLGLDKVEYMTSTGESLGCIVESGVAERAANEERAKLIKDRLLRASVLVGDDDEFM